MKNSFLVNNINNSPSNINYNTQWYTQPTQLRLILATNAAAGP